VIGALPRHIDLLVIRSGIACDLGHDTRAADQNYSEFGSNVQILLSGMLLYALVRYFAGTPELAVLAKGEERKLKEYHPILLSTGIPPI